MCSLIYTNIMLCYWFLTKELNGVWSDAALGICTGRAAGWMWAPGRLSKRSWNSQTVVKIRPQLVWLKSSDAVSPRPHSARLLSPVLLSRTPAEKVWKEDSLFLLAHQSTPELTGNHPGIKQKLSNGEKNQCYIWYFLYFFAKSWPSHTVHS